MQRGKNKLYNNLVPEFTSGVGQFKKRNTSIEARRDVMAHRYYFHAIMCRLRYDDCIINLHHEFFLQPNTVIRELELRLDLINQLVKQELNGGDLRKLYPWLNWTVKN